MSHNIPHVHEDQNSLHQIVHAKEAAAAALHQVQQVDHEIPNAIAHQAHDPHHHAASAQPAEGSKLGAAAPSSPLPRRVSKSEKTLTSSPEASVYGDMAASKIAPGLQLAGMGYSILTRNSGMGAFDTLSQEMARKPGFYNGKGAGGNGAAKAGGKNSIQTGFASASSQLGVRSDMLSDFFGSPLKGAQCSGKKSVPDLKHEKKLVCSKNQEAEQKFGAAHQAHQAKSFQIGMANSMGAVGVARKLQNDLSAGPKFKDPSKIAKAEEESIWGSGAAST